ncbi:signal peptidase I [Fusibacter paucivorans]|uniref:Signal peptidase I n=1 Tax=Fusibacter paucivorans TaxID=76009 RepID=A0ABS5PWM7_9FIRM|nr:signal peptidase I [Fusibacter paucivorans]
MKRVIGVPGDAIFIADTNGYINGTKLEESYIGSPTTGYVDIIEIPEGEYFLMGDNRSHSTDSRDNTIGTVSIDKIIGKSTYRLYPFSKIGKLY